MKKKYEKLIRGIIYDNPNDVAERAYETADMLVMATERASNFYDANKDVFKMENSEYFPNKEQFTASIITDMICHPLPGVENMIIPSDLVDNKLYKELKKIDIGEELTHAYMHLATEDYYDSIEEDKNIDEAVERFNFGVIDPMTGEKVVLESDLTREELIERIHNMNNLTGSELDKMINAAKVA